MSKWTERIRVTLTTEQREMIIRAAASYGMTVSIYSRLILTHISRNLLTEKSSYYVDFSFMKQHKQMSVSDEPESPAEK